METSKKLNNTHPDKITVFYLAYFFLKAMTPGRPRVEPAKQIEILTLLYRFHTNTLLKLRFFIKRKKNTKYKKVRVGNNWLPLVDLFRNQEIKINIDLSELFLGEFLTFERCEFFEPPARKTLRLK